MTSKPRSPTPSSGPAAQPAIGRLRAHLEQAHSRDLLGMYLHGSAAVGGLRPDSDLDVLVVMARSLSEDARERLVQLLLESSGRRATVTPGRPLEVTVLVLSDVAPWAYPPVCDLLYGEWLRDQVVAGGRLERHHSPDLAVLVTSVRQHAIRLSGPPAADLLPPVPVADLHRAIRDSLDPLLSDLVGDERNVLLTLARMVVTLETDRIVPKDEAATLLLPGLAEPDRSLLSLAARGYAGRAVDDWTGQRQAAADLARRLAERVRARA